MGSTAQHGSEYAQVDCDVDHQVLYIQGVPDQHQGIPPLDEDTVYLSLRYNKLKLMLIRYGILKP